VPIEGRPHLKKNAVAMELTNFSVFYLQDSIKNAVATIKNKSNRIAAKKGQFVKVSKDKNGAVTREGRFREQKRDHPREERGNGRK
jgi:hypothetical protein